MVTSPSRLWTFGCLTLALLIPSSVAEANKKKAQEGEAVFSPEAVEKKSPAALAAWLGYAGARIHFREEHGIPLPTGSESSTPSYEEEVFARDALASLWATLREGPEPDSYLETLTKVKEAGFLREYVHVFLVRQDSTKGGHTLRLTEFEEWRGLHLVDHKPETIAAIRAK